MTDEAEAMKGMAKCLIKMIESGFIQAIARGELATMEPEHVAGMVEVPPLVDTLRSQTSPTYSDPNRHK